MGKSFVSGVVRRRLQHEEVEFVASGCVTRIPGALLDDGKGGNLGDSSAGAVISWLTTGSQVPAVPRPSVRSGARAGFGSTAAAYSTPVTVFRAASARHRVASNRRSAVSAASSSSTSRAM
jgi:hypothetical protein